MFTSRIEIIYFQLKLKVWVHDNKTTLFLCLKNTSEKNKCKNWTEEIRKTLLNFGSVTVFLKGVANGKIRARDTVRKKTEPETSFCENPSQFQKLFAARHERTWYSKINKYKIDKSRVPKCHAMTTNLWLKNPTSRSEQKFPRPWIFLVPLATPSEVI